MWRHWLCLSSCNRTGMPQCSDGGRKTQRYCASLTRNDTSAVTVNGINAGAFLMGSELTVRPELNSCTVYQFVRSQSINIDNSFFQRVEQVKYLGIAITNQNSISMKLRAHCSQRMLAVIRCSIPRILSSSLVTKNLKIEIYRTIILLVVLYGCKTWSLTLREEHTPSVVENKVLRRVFALKRDEVTGELRKLHNEELNELFFSPTIVGVIKTRMRLAGHVARMGRGEAYAGFWLGNLRERDNLRDPGGDERIILRWIFRKCDVGVCTGSSWLRIGAGGRHL